MKVVACSAVHLAIFTIVAATASANASLAAQLRAGDLIVVDPHNRGVLGLPGQGVIVAINPTTGAQTLITQTTMLEQPSGIWIDSAGDVIVADYGFRGAGGVYRVDPATGHQSLISSGDLLNHATGVAIDSAGSLVVAQQGQNQTSGAILKIDPATGNQTPVSSGRPLSVTGGIAIEPNGSYLVANFQSNTAGSSVIRVDASTGAQTVVSAAGELELGPHDVWVNSLQANSVFVTRAGLSATGQIVEVDTVTGQQTVVSTGGDLFLPIGITQDASGDLFVTDFGDGSPKILRIDPKTGDQTIVSSGGFLQTPVDIFVYVPEPSSVVLAAICAAAASWIVVWRRC